MCLTNDSMALYFNNNHLFYYIMKFTPKLSQKIIIKWLFKYHYSREMIFKQLFSGNFYTISILLTIKKPHIALKINSLSINTLIENLFNF